MGFVKGGNLIKYDYFVEGLSGTFLPSLRQILIRMKNSNYSAWKKSRQKQPLYNIEEKVRYQSSKSFNLHEFLEIIMKVLNPAGFMV